MAAATSYTPPSFGQPGVSVSYQPKSLVADACVPCPVVTVAVPPAAIHGIFAHRQWRAGMLMSDALLSGAFPIAKRTVLELGAGTGLPCITACHVGTASTIVCSDYDQPELVRALRDNVRANCPSDAQLARLLKVVGHIWGTNTDELVDALPSGGGHKFHVVLLADCLWDPLSHAALLKTVVATLARTSMARVHVIAGLHTGRDKITSFVRRAYRAGLILAPVDVPQVWPALDPAFAGIDDPVAGLEGNEPFAHAAERILELQVCGTATAHPADQPPSDVDLLDPPRLTGLRRPFLLDGYGVDEDDVHKRNRWLTVWSLMWAQQT